MSNADVGRRTLKRLPWTAEHDAQLSELYKTKPITAIAQAMGRTSGSIFNRVQKLGLKRSDEYKQLSGCGRFKKGGAPWNAGMKGWNAGGKSKDTQFKPGNVSSTWRPIGAERVSKDGILYRKVADTRNKKVDWRPVHELIWEEHHGPIPEGNFVIFIDRNRSNFAIENLLAVLRSTGQRNRGRRYGPEYRQQSPWVGSMKNKKVENERRDRIS
ncbi:HNH endonuclease [Ectopseudomonas mendocina]|uniref:HNH endonuclease n=1 Tax=Ectopseudomonas mendocina TaxID=300 RepID=A0ABZ2RAA9_ECTME